MGGIFGGGGSAQSVSTVDNRISAMQIQTSNYGKAISIIYGTTRVSPNLLYYTDFTAIAHTTVTSSGGGGGGGKGGGGGGGGSSSNTTYTYKTALLMALGEGVISNVGSIWRSKDKFVVKPDYVSNDETIVGYTNVVYGYDDSGNPLYASGPEWADWGSTPITEIVQTYHPPVPALDQLGMALATGEIGQAPQPYLLSNHPSEALGYSGIAYVYGWSIDLQNSAAMYNYSFEAYGKFQYGNGILDANPKDVIFDALTSTQYGSGFNSSDFGSLTDFSNYCIAAGLFISPAYDAQKSGADIVTEVALMTNSAPVYSDGLLKIIPYQDAPVSGNGVAYTPNIAPEYDLDGTDFIVQNTSDDPIKITRKTSADAFNQVQVEFMNRSNDYNIDIATAKDQASIEAIGLRPQDVVKLHGICDPVVANKVAENIKQRVLYIRNTYEFTLGWRYSRLEPMDIVTLTDSVLELNRYPVRITTVEEDEIGNLLITAEDCNFGTASSAIYPHQDNSGFAHNFNAEPGNVAIPMFFEPPVDLTTNGLEVWAAVSGLKDGWGGCSVWVSLDGATYKKQGQIYGGARYGALTANLDQNNSLSIALAGNGGQLFSGSLEDAKALLTLSVVTDGVNTEYLSYQTATLTSKNAYTLTGLIRGAYRSNILNKLPGAKYARIDSAISKSDPLDLSLVGKKIYFKFTSFNSYLGGEQSLADVSSYSYQITGEMLRIPPDNVQAFAIDENASKFTLTWNPVSNSNLSGYEIRWINGDSRDWGNATPIHQGILVSSPYISANKPTGFGTLMIKAVNKFNESLVPSAIVINLGDALVANVIETIDIGAAGFPGGITGGSIVDGKLVANEQEIFWNPNDTANMWHTNSTAMWRPQTYSEMVYEATIQAPPGVDGSQLTIPYVIDGNNWKIEYRKIGPPMWTHDDRLMWSSDDRSMWLFEGPVMWTIDANPMWNQDANPMWSLPDYLPWPGAITATEDQYQIRISIGFGGTQGTVSALSANFDVPDKTEVFSAVSIADSGSRLPITKNFISIKTVNLSLLSDTGSAFIARVVDKNSDLGPLVQCFDSSNNPIAGKVDATIQGY
ncbi:phage tail protein [Polynucleobacter sp. AP-RePozz3-80-G7]|uniref:phage tail protein n=1 Tax=Polynucleobacter sp. AP-RePozz3-80-G7 TaxID=2689105 RepID=UPI001C0B0466|nr:phage tail protein [Polynucleobacter sp. AP-RePozz3-80-G7]MBU3640022.1 hypothetical protein [Polynucleobacter sp. AP-RePozz3-80-G7]